MVDTKPYYYVRCIQHGKFPRLLACKDLQEAAWLAEFAPRNYTAMKFVDVIKMVPTELTQEEKAEFERLSRESSYP